MNAVCQAAMVRVGPAAGGLIRSSAASAVRTTSAGAGRGHARVAELELVLQVVAAVPLDHVEQQQRPADGPGLGAGVAGAGDDQVAGGHQLGYPVGEAERADPRLAVRHRPQPALEPGVAARRPPARARRRRRAPRPPRRPGRGPRRRVISSTQRSRRRHAELARARAAGRRVVERRPARRPGRPAPAPRARTGAPPRSATSEVTRYRSTFGCTHSRCGVTSVQNTTWLMAGYRVGAAC